jgi:prepilin-type N-terminal cleavage/methylation domain-containing protein
MTSRKGFTLIELMVVIFIVGILAAVAIPIMRGRIDAAKWSEGKSAMGSIRTAARSLIAEKGNSYDFASHNDLAKDLGFATGDLDGKYFLTGCYAITFVNGSGTPPAAPTYTITCTASSGTADKPTTPSVVTLKQDGTFTETP